MPKRNSPEIEPEIQEVRSEDAARDLADILGRALVLPEEQRAELVLRLLESLEGEPEEGAEEAWADVVADRIEELRDGRVQTISADEAMARVEERLRARRG